MWWRPTFLWQTGAIQPQGAGAYVKILTGMLVLFFWVWNLAKSYFSGLANFLAFFWVLQNFQLFFWVWQISSYFFGSDKFPAIFLGLPIFVSYIWILCMKNTKYWKTLNHSCFSYLFELRQTLHLESFYFFGFEFWGILLFWGLNLESFYFFG